MLRRLMKSIGEYRRLSILTPILVSFEVVIECFIPFIIADLVNKIGDGCEFDIILWRGALLALLAIASLAFGAAAGVTASRAASGFAKNLRRDMFYKIQDFSFENIDSFSTASLVTRLTTDISNVQMAYMMIIRTAVRAPFMFAFAFVMAFVMGGSMAWIFVFVVPILLFGLAFVIFRAMPIFKKVFKKYDKLNASVQENIKGMRVVKSFVRQDYEREKFAVASDDVCRDFTRADRILALNSPIMQFCMYSIMLFVLTYGSYTVVNSRGLDLDVGQLSALLTYGVMILTSLMMISMIFVMVTLAIESSKRINEVLTSTSNLTSPEDAIFEIKDGSVDFKNVSFKYSKSAALDALSGVNLHICSGQTVGIIGGTGSSKSTLVQLISRLYDVTEGDLLVGGVNVKKYDLKTLRDTVAVVLQKNLLFSGSIRDNLKWGDSKATDEEIWTALRLSSAEDFVSSFPDKLDTHIEEGGTNVSGGQRQRLCIARALLKKPKILILDDSTSAVDTRTDASIRKSMREFIPETTKIIIAQRISSVMDSDLIVVMDGGAISAVGTHDELLSSSEIYREVFTSQNKVREEESV